MASEQRRTGAPATAIAVAVARAASLTAMAAAWLDVARDRLPARWRRRLLIGLAAFVYVALWAMSAFDKVNPTDLDIFFIPTTRIALAGHPLLVYTMRDGTYPNANGPLSLLPLTLGAWLALARGWLNDPMLRRSLVFVVCAPFPLLVAWEAMRAIERFGPPLRGAMRLLLALPILLTPLLWLDALYYGHIEQCIVIWLALAATRQLADARYLSGGALLGLALLARSDALLIALALGLTLLAWRRWRATLLTLLGACGAVLLGLAPFLIADWSDVVYSLVTFRGSLPVGGGDLWSVSGAPIVLQAAQRFDALFTVLIAALLVLGAHALRAGLDLDSPDIYGLMALASFCFALLIKTLWPYYFLESALLATVWALASMPRATAARPQITRNEWLAWALLWLAPLAISISAIMSEYGLEAVNYDGWRQPWIQVNIFCGLLTLAILLATLLGGPRLRALLVGDDATPTPERILGGSVARTPASASPTNATNAANAALDG